MPASQFFAGGIRPQKTFSLDGRDLAKTFSLDGRSGLEPRVRARDNKALQDDGGG